MPESLFKLHIVPTSPGKTWKVLEVEESPEKLERALEILLKFFLKSLGRVLKSFCGQTVQKRDF